MNLRHTCSFFPPACAVLLASMTGCGIDPAAKFPSTQAATIQVLGHVHGGQQPVTGAKVYLYAVSTTATAGAATSLLSNPSYVLTDANGNFSIPSHSCPVGAYVYVLALGGNPGLAPGTNNPDLALAAGLGSCQVARSMTVNIDEVTTVATAYALAGYAASETQIGANIDITTDAVNLEDAFAMISDLVDLPGGSARTATLDGTGTVPQPTIDSLADSLAACVNSDGTGSPCSSLMAAANVTNLNGLPVDTFQAALNIAQAPASNVPAIFGLASGNSPFQPALSSAPTTWAIAITYNSVPPVAVTLTPTSATISQTSVQDFVATITGISAPGYSYKWTVTGANGTLTENGDQGRVAQTGYCSTSNVATYQPTASPNLNASDSITVIVYNAPGCLSANLLGQAPSAQVTLTGYSQPPTPYIPALPTASFNGTVVLPSGIALTPNQLTIMTSIGSVTPQANGSFTLPIYALGPQMAIVNSPAGNPMLMGWLDATHTTISAGTTAEVLAYYALGGSGMLTLSDRQTLEASIMTASGLPALTQVVSSELVANPNAFAHLDTNLKTALDSFFTSLTGIIPQIARPGTGVAKPQDILVNPSPGTQQSGQSVQQLPPFEADVVNYFRRRSHAFVTRVSDNFGSGVQQDPLDFGEFDVSPAIGLTGGVTGTITDIFNAYYGNQPTAYGPLTSDPFSIPLTTNSQTTTYSVVIVGPGAPNSVSNGLTAAQASAQVQVAVGGFVTDALIPFCANFLFGSNFLPANFGGVQATASTAFMAAFRNNLTNDFLNYLSNAPTLQAQISAGQYGQAMAGLFNAGASGGAIQALTTQAALQSANSPLATAGFSSAIGSFNIALQAAGGALQFFDSAVYAKQILQSNAADQWTLTVTPQKVTLSPLSTTLPQTGGTGFQLLTLALPGVDSLSGYSFLFTNTAAAGDLSAIQGPGQGTSFCTAFSQVHYTVRPLPVLTSTTTDTITAQAFSGPGCRTANLVGNASATVAVASTGVNITPGSATIMQQGPGSVGLTASTATTLPTPHTYLWTLVGTSGSSPAGTLTEVGGNNFTGKLTYCSVSPSATYIANASPVLTTTANDQVTVQAFSGANCATGTSIGTSLPALITVSAVSVLVQPLNQALQQDTQLAMTSTVQGTLANTTYSYRWTTNGTAGTLAEVGGTGQTGLSYCSTSLQANYIPNAAPVLATQVADTVAVQVFLGTGCAANAAVSAPVSTSVQVRPVITLATTQMNAPIFLQAGDGFYYGAATNGATQVSSLVQYNPDLTVHKVFTLPAGSFYGYLHLRVPIVGPDGNLYGYSSNGNFKVTLPAGTVTMLNNSSSAMILTTLASDGNFYGYMGLGFQAPDQSKPGIFARMTPTGVVTPLASLPASDTCTTVASDCSYIYTSLQATDGNFYAIAQDPHSYVVGPPCTEAPGQINSISPAGNFSAVADFNRCFAYNGSFGIDIGPTQNSLVQGPDGAVYGVTNHLLPLGHGSGQQSIPHGPAVFRESGGTITLVHELASLPVYNGSSTPTPNALPEGDLFNFTNGLIVGSDGNLYGSTVCWNTPGVSCPFGALFQLSTTGNFFAMHRFPFGAGNYPTSASAVFLQNNTGALMGFYTTQVNGNTVNNEFVSSLALPPPIQLSIVDPSSGNTVTTIQASTPLQIKWKVLNAFSLTAQQCTAQIQTFPAGAGTWSGPQFGAMTTDPISGANVYAGSASLTPTTAGTYTYALTCGGYESGYATLVVTP